MLLYFKIKECDACLISENTPKGDRLEAIKQLVNGLNDGAKNSASQIDKIIFLHYFHARFLYNRLAR